MAAGARVWDAPQRAEWFGGGYDVPGIHSICVDPRNSEHVLVAVSSTGLRADYMPPELNENEAVQDRHCVVRSAGNPDNPDMLWCQHHSGIWRSLDNGRHWEEIVNPPVSNFGFAVALHPHDGNTAWFAPAEADRRRIPVATAMALRRTGDGGQNFSVLRERLPQEQCYDLVYRHGLAVSNDGNSLLMASSSGGVWLSDDAGARWQTVSNNMPPGYAICFA